VPLLENIPVKKTFFGTLKRNLLLTVLLLLLLLSFVSVHVSLLAAIAFTFLVPGLTLCRFFRLSSWELLVFIPTLSVLVSTQIVYYMSLVFGYSQLTITTAFLVLTVVYGIVEWRKQTTYPFKDFLKTGKHNRIILSILVLILVLSLAVLYRSVWFETNSGIVLTGSNWQDTPIHYEIIESINNGNFPPQMPYYSGEMMTYHYFVDFHTAILEKVYGFLPQLVPFLNAIFIAIFALAVYSLSRVNGRREAAFSTIIATVGWGFSYFMLFSALANNSFNPTQNYAYQYDGLFGLPPIFDNLLQQRPLLVGLPVFAFVLALLKDMENKNRVILAGIVTGLVFPFHAVSFICCYVAYLASILLNSKTFQKHYLYFLVSAGLALPFILSGGASVPIILAPLWALSFLKDNYPILFYFLNLGIPFMLTLAFVKKVGNTFLKLVFLFLFLIPNLVSVTPNPWDMYKFFIFAWIPLAVLSGAALARIKRSVALALLLLSVLSSASVIIYNLGTDYTAVSWSEYDLGMWVRENTPERSVFLTYYSIHCPPIMIGGRLAVASYANWPYGHGVPLDDIYKRFGDIDRAYEGSAEDLLQVVEAYKVTYIYVGTDELLNYPGCTERLDSVEWLQPVYNGTLRIYKVAS